jgi:cytoskeletal protein RodZ
MNLSLYFALQKMKIFVSLTNVSLLFQGIELAESLYKVYKFTIQTQNKTILSSPHSSSQSLSLQTTPSSTSSTFSSSTPTPPITTITKTTTTTTTMSSTTQTLLEDQSPTLSSFQVNDSFSLFSNKKRKLTGPSHLS